MDTATTGLKEALIALNFYIRKEESSQTSDLSFYLKKLGRKKKMNQIKEKKGKNIEEIYYKELANVTVAAG